MEQRSLEQPEPRRAGPMPRVAPEAVGESRREYTQPERQPRGFLAFVGTASGVFFGAVIVALIMLVVIVMLAT